MDTHITIECNTALDTIKQHIAYNSRRDIPWVAETPAHEGHAVIVGSGPSVADCLDSLRRRKAEGQTIFALNGAAKFLHEHGIEVDHSVIVDARSENRGFLGYAKNYLLASQCAPAMFDRDNVTLWHAYVPEIADFYPAHDGEYALIGGGTTVGLSALCLAYTLGYRKLHLYGYDSSYREDKGHAFDQPMNANDSCCYVSVDGVRYKASIAMAAQAEQFPILANDLIDRGCIITVDGDGLLPAIVRRQPAIPEPELFLDERSKYQALWTHEAYRKVSPGELIAPKFVEVCKPQGRVIDFGCGTGRASVQISRLADCEVFQVDFTANSRDSEQFVFVQCDLTKRIPVNGDFGFCADVMEHIRPEDVRSVIRNIMESTPRAFFQICLVEDHCGALIGETLHLSVHPASWWQSEFEALGYSVLWSEANDINACFYISTP